MIVDEESFMRGMHALIDGVRGDYEAGLLDHSSLVDHLGLYARESSIYKRVDREGFRMFDGWTAARVYRYLIIKLAGAPTQLHAVGSAFVLMPVVADKLREELRHETSHA